MWYRLKYDLVNRIVSHIVQEELLGWHRDYIDKKYSLSEIDCSEASSFRLDPGGMMFQNGETISIKFDDGSHAIANLEHLLSLMEFYFCEEELLERQHENNGNIMSKLIDDNIVKIYMPYTCIVMTLDRYNKIYNSLSDNYVHGFNCYLEMLNRIYTRIQSNIFSYSCAF